ncbi:MAG: C4-dicarboxylate ABC transporter substrate-binding protein [Paracoccaceae bacterium]|nr:MAG: C4-dicarboxylate ABC transporter substrate-binding protein [Paracoccaceae bacterium]
MHRAIRRAADGLIEFAAAIGALGLMIEVVVILADVVGRAFGHPLYGSQDLITMAMIPVVFGAMALCDRLGGHIAVDLLQPRLPAALNRALDIFSALLGAAIFLTLAWAVHESARFSVMLNLSTNLLNLPKAWFQWTLAALALVTALGMVLRAVALVFGPAGRVRERGEVAR